MFPDLRGRQFAHPRKLVDRGLGHPEKARHIRDGQNLVVRDWDSVGMDGSWCRHDSTHSHAVIGIAVTNLSAAARSRP